MTLRPRLPVTGCVFEPSLPLRAAASAQCGGVEADFWRRHKPFNRQNMAYLTCSLFVPLQRHPPNAAVWEQAFGATDQGLECDDGCTATAALAWMDEGGALNLQTANVGDSSGVWIPAPDGGPLQVGVRLIVLVGMIPCRKLEDKDLAWFSNYF